MWSKGIYKLKESLKKSVKKYDKDKSENSSLECEWKSRVLISLSEPSALSKVHFGQRKTPDQQIVFTTYWELPFSPWHIVVLDNYTSGSEWHASPHSQASHWERNLVWKVGIMVNIVLTWDHYIYNTLYTSQARMFYHSCTTFLRQCK